MSVPRGSRVAQYADALATVAYLAGSEEVALEWMVIPREQLGGKTARQMIVEGHGDAVMRLVDEEFDACQN